MLRTCNVRSKGRSPVKTTRLALAALALAATAACTTGPGRPGPVDVTRYHLGEALNRGTFAIEPLAPAGYVSPEYQMYADAVAAQVRTLGFTPAPDAASSDYLVAVEFVRQSRGVVNDRPPVSVGLGGGGGSYGGGVGAGVSFGIGGGPRDVVASELHVQLRRRSDKTMVWEGRANTQYVDRGAQPIDVSAKLAAALFRGFPGESGITTTVR